MNASLVLAERTDVLLADLPFALAALSDSPAFAADKIVLVVATEFSTLLPCCGQSLGYRNQQLSKLWTAAHLKTEACGAYWKNVHLLCVRKLRKNSAYAKEEEVLAVLDDTTTWAKERFLHHLRPVASPASKPKSRPALAPRVSAIQTPVTAPTAKQARLSTKPSLTSLNGRSPPDAARTAKPVSACPSARRRSSEGPKERSPVVTRRKSSVLKPDNKSPNTAPASKPAKALPSDSTARRLSAASTTAPKAVTRKSSVASISTAALGPTGRPKTVVWRVVSAPSAIPTPTRRLSADLLGKDGAGSPGTPLVAASRRASVATSPISQPMSMRRSLLAMSQGAPTSSVASPNHASIASKEHESRLVHLSQIIAQLKTDLSSAACRNEGLENELSTLKKQKSLLEKGNQVLISEMKKLKEQLGLQEEAADLLAKSWEKRCRELEEENARLELVIPDSEVRGEINQEEDTSFESESTAKSVSEAFTPPCSPPTTPLRFLTPAVGSIATSKVASYAFHTPTAQYPPKLSLNQSSSTPFFTPAAPGQAGPANTPSESAVASRKVRTPASAAKRGGGKKTIGIWKRLAKRRLFGL